MANEVLEDQLRNEPAHAFRVGNRRRGVKPPFLVLADRLLSVALLASVAARIRKWANVVAGWVEHGPANIAEVLHAIQVGKESRRLGIVAVRKLALVACDRSETRFPMRSPNAFKLPNAGWLASRDATKILVMFK